MNFDLPDKTKWYATGFILFKVFVFISFTSVKMILQWHCKRYMFSVNIAITNINCCLQVVMLVTH